jgi:hypothetical protein
MGRVGRDVMKMSREHRAIENKCQCTTVKKRLLDFGKEDWDLLLDACLKGTCTATKEMLKVRKFVNGILWTNSKKTLQRRALAYHFQGINEISEIIISRMVLYLLEREKV